MDPTVSMRLLHRRRCQSRAKHKLNACRQTLVSVADEDKLWKMERTDRKQGNFQLATEPTPIVGVFHVDDSKCKNADVVVRADGNRSEENSSFIRARDMSAIETNDGQRSLKLREPRLQTDKRTTESGRLLHTSFENTV